MAATSLSYWYIKDYANQVCTTDSYGYETCNTPGLHDLSLDLGAGAQTKWYMRIYNASSPASFSTATYTFTGSEGGYGGDSISSSGTPAFPVSLSEGDSYEIYAEVYDPSSTLIAVAGSSSAPYFGTTPDSWTAAPGYQPGQYTLTMGSEVGALHGDVVDVTVTVPSGHAGTSIYDAFLNVNPNPSAYEYGWDAYSTTWAFSGSDTAIIDSSSMPAYATGSVSLSWNASTVPAVGTYTFTVVAQANIGQNTTFNVTVIVQ